MKAARSSLKSTEGVARPTVPAAGIKDDPNRPDDPDYIVRLIGKVIHVSIETMRIVGSLPAFTSPHVG